MSRRLIELPEKEELKRLIMEHKGYEPRMRNSLETRGIKVCLTTLAKWINQDKELKELISEVRQAREKEREEEEAQKQAIRQVEIISLQNAKIPLSDEEIVVLSAYQEGDSLQTLANKVSKPGGRIDSLINSILLKKNVATLGEAKEKFSKEMVTA